MASTASPYGLRAVNELGGLPYAGSTRSFPITPAGYANNIYNGSVVFVGTDGYLQLVTGTGADGTTNSFPGSGTLSVALMSTHKVRHSSRSTTLLTL
jgi:hypothetical protein